MGSQLAIPVSRPSYLQIAGAKGRSKNRIRSEQRNRVKTRAKGRGSNRWTVSNNLPPSDYDNPLVGLSTYQSPITHSNRRSATTVLYYTVLHVLFIPGRYNLTYRSRHTAATSASRFA